MSNDETRRIPQQARSIEKKKRIIDAALRIFGDKGFQATTAKHVAEAAGVSVGTFYAYFKDKKVLLMEILVHHMESVGDSIFTQMPQMIASGITGRELLARIVERGDRSHNQEPGLLRTMLAMRYTDEDLAEFSRNGDAAMLSRLAAFLESIEDRLRVTDTDAAARVIANAFEETMHTVAIGEADIDKARLYEALVDMTAVYLFTDPDAHL